MSTVIWETPDASGCDLAGALVRIPPGRYDWIYLKLAAPWQAAAESRAEAWLHYSDAVDPEWLYLTPGATDARIPVPRLQFLHLLRLPRLPSLPLRALTLVPRSQW